VEEFSHGLFDLQELPKLSTLEFSKCAAEIAGVPVSFLRYLGGDRSRFVD